MVKSCLNHYLALSSFNIVECIVVKIKRVLICGIASDIRFFKVLHANCKFIPFIILISCEIRDICFQNFRPFNT